MSTIDKQRIAAVRTLQALGYAFVAGEWKAPMDTAPSLVSSTDAMLAYLMRRADELAGCTKGSDEEGELEAITDANEAYEAVRGRRAKFPVARDECLT
jgi:hypothetical protein